MIEVSESLLNALESKRWTGSKKPKVKLTHRRIKPVSFTADIQTKNEQQEAIHDVVATSKTNIWIAGIADYNPTRQPTYYGAGYYNGEEIKGVKNTGGHWGMRLSKGIDGAIWYWGFTDKVRVGRIVKDAYYEKWVSERLWGDIRSIYIAAVSANECYITYWDRPPENKGWITRRILRTTDGGATWQTVWEQKIPNVFSIFIWAETKEYVPGDIVIYGQEGGIDVYYVCKVACINKRPDLYPEYWVKVKPGVMRYDVYRTYGFLGFTNNSWFFVARDYGEDYQKDEIMVLFCDKGELKRLNLPKSKYEQKEFIYVYPVTGRTSKTVSMITALSERPGPGQNPRWISYLILFDGQSWELIDNWGQDVLRYEDFKSALRIKNEIFLYTNAQLSGYRVRLYHYSPQEGWVLRYYKKYGDYEYTKFPMDVDKSGVAYLVYCVDPGGVRERIKIIEGEVDPERKYTNWYWKRDKSQTLSINKEWTCITRAGRKTWIANAEGEIFMHNGRYWTREWEFANEWRISGLAAVDEDVVYACGWRTIEQGTQSAIWRRTITNGELEWQVVYHDFNEKLLCIWATPASFWALGEYGLRITGRDWSYTIQREANRTNYHQFEHVSIHGYSSTDIWAVGHGGRAFHFDGIHWNDDPGSGLPPNKYFTSADIDLKFVNCAPATVAYPRAIYASGTEYQVGPVLMYRKQGSEQWYKTQRVEMQAEGKGIFARGYRRYNWVYDNKIIHFYPKSPDVEFQLADEQEVETESGENFTLTTVLTTSPYSGWLIGRSDKASGVWRLSPPVGSDRDISKYLENLEVSATYEPDAMSATFLLKDPNYYLISAIEPSDEIDVKVTLGSNEWLKFGTYSVDRVETDYQNAKINVSGRSKYLKMLLDSIIPEELTYTEYPVPANELIEAILSSIGIPYEDYLVCDEPPAYVQPSFSPNTTAMQAILECLKSAPWWRILERFDGMLIIGPPPESGKPDYTGWKQRLGFNPFYDIGEFTISDSSTIELSVTGDDSEVYTGAVIEAKEMEIEDEFLGIGDGQRAVYDTSRKPVVPESEKISVCGQLKERGVDYEIDYPAGKIRFYAGSIPPDTAYSPNLYKLHKYQIVVPEEPDMHGIGYGCPQAWFIEGLQRDGTWVELDRRTLSRAQGWTGESVEFVPRTIPPEGCRQFRLHILNTFGRYRSQAPEEFDPEAEYNVGDEVTYNGYIYRMIKPYPEPWNSGEQYNTGDLVRVGAIVYFALQSSQGQAPGPNTQYWIAHYRLNTVNNPHWVYVGYGFVELTRPNIVQLLLYNEEDEQFAPTDMMDYVKVIEEGGEIKYTITAMANSEFVYPDGARRPAWYAFDGNSDTRWIPATHRSGILAIDFGDTVITGYCEVRCSYKVKFTIYHEFSAPTRFAGVPPQKWLYVEFPKIGTLENLEELAEEIEKAYIDVGLTTSIKTTLKPHITPGDNCYIETTGGMHDGMACEVVHNIGDRGFMSQLKISSGRKASTYSLAYLLSKYL